MLPTGVETAVVDSASYFVHLGVVLFPLFIGASFLVGLTQEYLPPERVERLLHQHDEGSGNVLAAGLGAVTPFCSCSTIPILAGLLQAGAPLGLAFTFLLASPIVNEIAIILLFGIFGLEVTLAYLAATVTAAIVGGILVGRLGLIEYVKDEHLPAAGAGEPAVAADGGTTDCCESTTAESASACCSTDDATTGRHRRRVRTAARGAWSFFVDTLPYLLLGMTIGALIHGAVPVEVVQTVLGPANPLAVPLAAILGAPVYISVSGMLPIAASLSEQGIAIGTVVAFVIGGAGVSIPNLVILNTLFERRLLAIYASIVVAIGTVIGLVFNLVLV